MKPHQEIETRLDERAFGEPIRPREKGLYREQ